MSRTEIHFEKGDLRDFEVREIRGREAMSELFEFEIELRPTHGTELDELAAALLDEATGATLSIVTPEHGAHFHGMIRAVRTCPAESADRAVYRVSLVPRLWVASRTRRSRLFEKMTVVEIVAFILEHDYHFEPNKDFTFHCQPHYPKEEWLLQYEESDYAFLSRICEYYGIAFFFRFDERLVREVVVFSDHNAALPEYPGNDGDRIPFVPKARDGLRTSSILEIARDCDSPHPNHLLVHGFDAHHPGKHVVGERHRPRKKQLSPWCFFWSDTDDPREATFLAERRLEEFEVWRTRYQARSNVANLRAGERFSLDEHFDPSFARRPLIATAITHRSAQSPGGAGSLGGSLEGYQNEIEAVDHHGAPFRPQRRTPWPHIDGVIPARIAERPGMGNAGEMDNFGRYRVVLPFPTVNDGKERESSASLKWLRLVQPYAAQANSRGAVGFHHPLHQGTEVMLVHVDGDPDRPLIAGAVPNGLAPSPIYDGVGTRGGFKTRSGVSVQYDDDA